MKIALLQMVSTPDLQDNLAQARALLEEAAAGGAVLAVLPEYFCLFGHHERDNVAVAEQPGSGPVQDFLASRAQLPSLAHRVL